MGQTISQICKLMNTAGITAEKPPEKLPGPCILLHLALPGGRTSAAQKSSPKMPKH